MKKGKHFKYYKLVYIARVRAGYTQTALAKKCGMKQETIARIENGHLPTIHTLERIASALGKRLNVTFD